jgi:tetratricopeptide (TPR) repeat protein
VKVSEPRPADPFEVELALARLTAMLDRRDEAAARLGRLTMDQPKRWEPFEALGQLAWRKGEMDRARNWFLKAVELQPENWHVYWDYARLARVGGVPDVPVVDALRRLLKLNQSHLDAKLMLAEELYRDKQYSEAQGIYAGITKVDPDRATRLFLGKAYVLLRLQGFQEARAEAEKVLKYAKEPSRISSAESILKFLDQREEFEKRGHSLPVESTAAGLSPEAPGTQTVRPAEQPILPAVRGVLREIECRGTTARLLLQAGQRQIGFIIADPGRVVNRNSPGTGIDLTCGKQRPGVNVLIEFEEKPDDELGTLGEVRAIEFLK